MIDTQHAIDPAKYRHEWQTVTPSDIIDRIQPYPKRVTLTGGEPFLQPEKDMDRLLALLQAYQYAAEVFTNGTTAWPDSVGYWNDLVHIIMDWKLKGSGEDPLDEKRLENLKRLGAKDAVKFVIKDEDDFKQAVHLWEAFIVRRTPAQVYYGAVWGAIENAELVKWVQEERLDWKLNLQTHNYIFDREKRGI